MNDEKDIWAERLRDRDYAKMDPDPFIHEWIKRVAKKGARAPDIGCGWGRHLRVLCMAGYDAVGLDKSIGMLAAANENMQRLGFEPELLEDNVTHMPFPAENFQLIICTRTIHHGDRRFMVQSLKEIERVLATGGYLLASFPSVNDWRFGDGIAVEPGTFIPDLNQEEGGIPHHYSNADELLRWLRNYEIKGWEEVLKPYERKLTAEDIDELSRFVESPVYVGLRMDESKYEKKHWATYFVAAKKKSADESAL